MGKPSRDKGEWRALAALPDYEVSECGDVRRVTAARTRRAGHFPRGGIRGGYRSFKLATPNGKRQFWAHRLVCEAWHGAAPTERHEVAHCDGDRLNNHYSNLRWATRAENHADLKLHGTSVVGERNGRAILTHSEVVAARKAYTGAHGEIARLARRYGVSHSAMRSVLKREHWSHV